MFPLVWSGDGPDGQSQSEESGKARTRTARRCCNSAGKAEEKPRTPVRAATPMATDTSTKRNLAREERISRAAMRAAEVQVRELAMD